ncbi:hypothetical protein PoB_005632400 [Plakobranchus ocellatus]|uniref:F5/8 type C domain-containing protein n=1 Tax=Plakobranchus ocellatus TaxID=259542 RepID=A0AAV4CG96_9GAST|nr:hypothetical protein PoB_005632400 [Plakobranchus ocellatus]
MRCPQLVQHQKTLQGNCTPDLTLVSTMRTFATFVVALSVLGVFAQNDEEPVKCTPLPYTASSFSSLAMQDAKVAADFSRLMNLYTYPNGDWRVGDFNTGAVYTFTNGGCQQTSVFGKGITFNTFRDNSVWQYSYGDSENEEYNAWAIDIGNMTMTVLLNGDCINFMTKTSVNGVTTAVEYLYNINTVNPDFTELDEKLALIQDPNFCT